MYITVLNTEFEAVGIIDSFVSSIWTVRYSEYGDFELTLPMDISLFDVLKEDYYLITEDSDRCMIIEDLETITDADEGECIKVTGRSLEIIIGRRVVLNKVIFEGKYDNQGNKISTPNLQDGIEQIFNENIINPSIAARKIPNFIFERSSDEAITSLTIEAQYYGDNVYDVVATHCYENQIGFKVTLEENYEKADGTIVPYAFVFKLFAGADRTYDQFDNPYVIFSPDNDNLLSSNYYKSKSTYKNVAIVAGEEPETESEQRTVVTFGNGLGLDRREIFSDGSDISTYVDEETELTDSQYRAHLKQRAIDLLMENTEIEVFEGEIEATIMYKYGEDFFIGDIVQLVDKYGHEGQAYISEFIISQDKTGISRYPTFITLQEGVYDYE